MSLTTSRSLSVDGAAGEQSKRASEGNLLSGVGVGLAHIAAEFALVYHVIDAPCYRRGAA